MSATPPPTARHATDAMPGPFVIRFVDVSIPMAFPADTTRGEVRRVAEKTLASGYWGSTALVYQGENVDIEGRTGIRQSGWHPLEEVTR